MGHPQHFQTPEQAAEAVRTIQQHVEEGSIDLDLVEKIAHNEIDKMRLKGNFEHEAYYALADNDVMLYMDMNDGANGKNRILEGIAEKTDSSLTAGAMSSRYFTPEYALGVAVANVAMYHAASDIEAHDRNFSDRAIGMLNDFDFGRTVSQALTMSNKYDRAGIDVHQQFPVGFVSIQDCIDAAYERTPDGVYLDDVTPSDYQKIAYDVAKETAMDYEGAKDLILSDMAQAVCDLVVERDDKEGPVDGLGVKEVGESLDDMMSAKTSEAEIGESCGDISADKERC